MRCTKCECDIDNPYRLGSQYLCRDCYEDVQRRIARDAYHNCSEIQNRRMMAKERTGRLRREHPHMTSVKHHDRIVELE